jgi:hypothetical protein
MRETRRPAFQWWRGLCQLAIGKRLKLCETAGHHGRAYAPPWRPPAQCRAVTADLPEKLCGSPEKPKRGPTFGLDTRRSPSGGAIVGEVRGPSPLRRKPHPRWLRRSSWSGRLAPELFGCLSGFRLLPYRHSGGIAPLGYDGVKVGHLLLRRAAHGLTATGFGDRIGSSDRWGTWRLGHGCALSDTESPRVW